MSASQKNKGRVTAAPKETDSKSDQFESYQVSCFFCLKPWEDGTYGIGVFKADVRHKDGRQIIIHYEVCPRCVDEMRQAEGQFDVWSLRARVQLEPVAERIAELGARHENG